MVKIKEQLFKYLFFACAVFGIIAVGLIIVYLFSTGLPIIFKIGIFKFIFGTEWNPTIGLYGILPMIVGSLYVTALSVLIGVTIGVLAAVFLSQYCKNRLVYNVLKQMINLLAGIPSVVYGYFGMKVLVPFIAKVTGTAGIGLLASSIVLGIMILPTIILISVNSLNSVPKIYYEGALALGANHNYAVFKTVLPAAKSGIFAGVILGVNRAIGETMAIVMVAGNIPQFPNSLFTGIRSLTGNIVIEMGYATGDHRSALIATGVVLFVFVLIILISFNLFMSAAEKNKKEGKKGKVKKLKPFIPPKGYKPKSKLSKKSTNTLLVFSYISIILAISALLYIITFVLVSGIPYINSDFLFGAFKWGGEPKMMPSLVSTLMVIFLCLIIAIPIGIFASIYLNEYTKKGSKIVKFIRMGIESLAGIPSIVYGLFGMLFFVNALMLGRSIYAGAFTMVLMILPVIIRTTEESLKAVPDSYREGSFALGAGKLRTIYKVVLPNALSGIITSVILSMGRIIGESAPLLFTLGTTGVMPKNFKSTGMTLAVFMYILSGEGLHENEGWAVGVVLIVTIILLNTIATLIEYMFTHKNKIKKHTRSSNAVTEK